MGSEVYSLIITAGSMVACMVLGQQKSKAGHPLARCQDTLGRWIRS